MPVPNFLRLANRIAQDEGFRAEPYKCTAGVWTIGYGHTDEIGPNTPRITEKEARKLLKSDIYTALEDCHHLYRNFGDLSSVHQEVLANMAFNLGLGSLSKFERMNAAVNAYQFTTWAEEMQDSLWWKQVGDRAKRLHSAVVSGVLA